MRLNQINNQNGKALIAIMWALGIILIIVILGVLLTVTGAYKFPQNAINYPVVGQFIARYGSFLEPETEEPTDGEIANPLEQGSMDSESAQTAVYIRDISLKAQQIDDLKGELETKNDQIAKLEEDLQSLKTQLDTYKQKNLKALINVYDRMETRAAKEILSQMNPERAAIILGSIKDRKAAEILAAMDTQTALAISQIMGGFDRESRREPTPPGGLRTTPPPPTVMPQTPANAMIPGGEITAPPSNPQSGIVGPMPAPEEKPKTEEEKKAEEEKNKEEEEKKSDNNKAKTESSST